MSAADTYGYAEEAGRPGVDDVKRDEEKGGGVTLRGLSADAPEGTVHRNLKARHLQMIALGGTIGTGLFVGSGTALHNGGPLGILLGYSIIGVAIGSMMVALGEMTTLYPVSGAFTHYAARFLDPAAAFALGWNYWYSYAITLPTEITVAAVVIDYWPGGAAVNSGVWITVFLVVVVSFNFMGVKYYGEAEFWFSVTKIITILGLILLGIVITAGGGPTHEAIGFRYWHSPGPLNQFNGIPGSLGRFLAVWKTLVSASFSFLGTEIVALTAGEAANPRRNVPKAIKRVFARIVFFYVIGVFIMGLITNPNDPGLLSPDNNASASPWVLGIRAAGIKVLPSIVNAVILISAFSAGNSDLYAASRTLYGLACDGKAPAIFRKCTKNGLPIWSLVMTALIGLLAYMALGTSSSTAFSYLSNLSTITGLITWIIINISYLRFYYGVKRQGIDRESFPFKAPFQPYFSYFGIVVFTLVTFFNGFDVFLAGNWSAADFVVDYVTIPIFFFLLVGWKLYHKTRLVSLDEMDFMTGRRELDDIAEQEAAKYSAPTTWYGKVWDFVM